MELEKLLLEMIQTSGTTVASKGIDKISNVIGTIFPFAGVKKRAVETYIRDIQNGDYTPDEKYILLAGVKKHCKELENQAKITEIAKQNAKDGTDFSMGSRVDDDWLSRFMDSAKFISDEETQLMWGKVLAGEFESPGSTPPSVIRILSELTKEYATIFSNLCSLQVELFVDTTKYIVSDMPVLLINLKNNTGYLQQLGINFTTLKELDQMGLINYSAIGFSRTFSRDTFPYIHIVSETNVLTAIDYPDQAFPLGQVDLTNAGSCISRFVLPKYNAKHMQAIKSYLESYKVTFSSTPGIKITAVREGVEKNRGYSYEKQWTVPL